MHLPLILLPLLAAAAQPDISPRAPITVTGHQWAPFISPMGEPFRAHTPADDTLANWFRQADRDHDGFLTSNEMVADAGRYFAILDVNHDGMIDPDELAQYESDIAPEIQVMTKTKRAPGSPAPQAKPSDDDAPLSDNRSDRRAAREHRNAEANSSLGLGGALQGAARYALLDIPEPVAAADTNFDRAITLDEFTTAAIARFHLLDRADQGKLSLAQLETMRPVAAAGQSSRRDQDAPDTRVGNPLPPGS